MHHLLDFLNHVLFTFGADHVTVGRAGRASPPVRLCVWLTVKAHIANFPGRPGQRRLLPRSCSCRPASTPTRPCRSSTWYSASSAGGSGSTEAQAGPGSGGPGLRPTELLGHCVEPVARGHGPADRRCSLGCQRRGPVLGCASPRPSRWPPSGCSTPRRSRIGTSGSPPTSSTFPSTVVKDLWLTAHRLRDPPGHDAWQACSHGRPSTGPTGPSRSRTETWLRHEPGVRSTASIVGKFVPTPYRGSLPLDW